MFILIVDSREFVIYEKIINHFTIKYPEKLLPTFIGHNNHSRDFSD